MFKNALVVRNVWVGAAAAIILGGCATVQPVNFPVASRDTERVDILSAYARAEKHGVSVAGYARSRSFTMLPWGSHLHVMAELKDGRLAVADAVWRPSVRQHARTASYRTLLRDVVVSEVKRIDVEYRSKRDE